MRYGIIGRGFGLYGYLPAVAERSSCDIRTLESYRPQFAERTDIAQYEGRMCFRATPQDVFSDSDAVVVALRPADQFALVTEMVQSGWRGVLFLEKPIAPNPAEAMRLLNFLFESGMTFRIGFTLAVTDWCHDLIGDFGLEKGPERIKAKVLWQFRAHHYSSDLQNWKRVRALGGGALRFYGIHLVGALALFGSWRANAYSAPSAAEGEEPECSFEVSNGFCEVTAGIKTNSIGAPSFSVRVDAGGGGLPPYRLLLEDPLSEKEPISGADRRIEYLGRILDSLQGGSSALYDGYRRHVELWADIEAKLASV